MSKYVVEITKEHMIKKFIDDEGKEYVNTWVVKGPGRIGTLEKALENQLEESGFENSEIMDAIYSEDLEDIWEAIREDN